MQWVNRLGLVLDFLAFWFAAPEILGEDRLRAMEGRLEKGTSVLSALGFASVVGLALIIAVMLLPDLATEWMAGESKIKSGASVVAVLVASVMVVLVVVASVGWSAGKVKPSCLVVAAIVLFALFLALEGYGLLVPVVAVMCTEAVGLLAASVALEVTGEAARAVQTKVIEPIVRKLADDGHVRRRSLAVGAVLFVLGFFLQLVAAF